MARPNRMRSPAAKGRGVKTAGLQGNDIGNEPLGAEPGPDSTLEYVHDSFALSSTAGRIGRGGLRWRKCIAPPPRHGADLDEAC
jgi:hypothetical protein